MSLFEATEYKQKIIDMRKKFEPTAEEDKKILKENPELRQLTDSVQSELIYKTKLEEALKDPNKYFTGKKTALEQIAQSVNNEFVTVYKKALEYSSNEEAKKIAKEAARVKKEVLFHEYESMYPPNMDKDLEHRILVDLRNRFGNNSA
jgi:hypothetical protein